MARLFAQFLILFAVLCTPVRAQDEAEKSSLIQFVEEQLSSGNRQIRLNGIQGTLSSNVSFDSITIADADGVWLTITEPQLVWSRAALLRGRLEIESLTAASIDIPRGPTPDESAPAPETGGIAIPELPVAVNLGQLNVPVVRFGDALFGLETEISVDGGLTLDGGSLTTNFEIVRLDGPGGELRLNVNYNGENDTIDLDVQLREPENGIIANLANLEGKPPVSLTITGNAPIDELRVALAFDVDAKRILNGNLRLDGEGNGLRIRADLGGPLSTILPAEYAELLGTSSRLVADAVRGDAGDIAINTLSLKSGVIDLSANAQLLADGFLSALKLDASIANISGEPVVVPSQGAPVTFAQGNIQIDYDAATSGRFNQKLTLTSLVTEGIKIADIALSTRGTISNAADPADRMIEFTTSGGLSGIQATDPAVSNAIGNEISIDGSGIWSTGKPLEFSAFDIEGATYAVRTNGQIQAAKFTGQIGLEASDLRSFSTLLERELSGSLGLVADGEISPISGAFDLTLNGVGNGLKTGIETLDKLLNGSSNLSGGIARGAEGIVFDRFRITNNQADIVLNGRYASNLADITARADLRDIGDIADAGTGAVAAVVSVKGTQLPYAFNANIDMARGTLSTKSVEALAVSFAGDFAGPEFAGTISGSGKVDQQPISLSGQISQDDASLVINDLAALIGGATLKADISRNIESGLIEGNALIEATDISSLAALALVDAEGGINAKIDLTAQNNQQLATVDASVARLRYEQNTIGAATVEARIVDLLGKPQINSKLSARDLSIAGTKIQLIDGTVITNGTATDFDVSARMAQENARIQTKGRFSQSASIQIIDLQTLDLQSDVGDANLTRPAQITIADGVTSIRQANLNVAGGSINIDGSVSDSLDLDINIASLPLSIVNAFNAELGLGGILQGQISARGSTAAPALTFKISGNGVTARQLQNAQIEPLSISASGDANIRAGNVLLRQLSVINAQAIQINGSGTIPFAGAGLNFSADGTAPLNVADRFLESRGASVSGTARFNITATGSTAAPQLNGLLSVAGGTLTDPLSNLKLRNIGLIAGLNGDAINIQQMNAELTSGGSIAASGTVGIAGDLPANISIQLNNARYSDGQTFATTVNGQLAVRGALMRDPTLSGRIDVGETEITIPESFASSSDVLEVTHIAPSAEILRTLERVAKASPLPTPSARPSILQLDLSIVAPSRIFVRGRGLDAELGGSITLRGPVTNLTPSGRFELRRGRLSLLSQRFDLDEGSVTLTGTLDPLLNFTVRTISGDVTAFIFLTGRASDLKVSFGSEPELPEDEVLAQIIFGQGIADLSPTQVARLASIAVELTGGNSPGLVDGIRGGLGLDDLDVVSDEDGNAAVKVGKYINDNIYLGVQAGQETEATINLDITDSLTARGAVSSDGETSLGIFFEKDY